MNAAKGLKAGSSQSASAATSPAKLLFFDLNLRHLWALLAIVERGSVSEAAKMVGISQPALTQAIAKLEEKLGATLFDRQSNGMYPTATGTLVAERVRRALRFITSSSREVSRTGSRGFERPERLITGTQLKALVDLSDAGNLADASDAIGISRRALHRNIRDLEQLCGRPLVEQRGKLVAITQAGEILARGARIAASEIEAAAVDCKEVGGAGDGRIVVGATAIARQDLLPDVILRLLDVAPAAKVEVVEGSSRRLTRLLRDGMIDCMVSLLSGFEAPDLAQIPIRLEYGKVGVFGRKHHPLSRLPKPSREDYRQYPWIIPWPPVPMRWSALVGTFERNFLAGIEGANACIRCSSVPIIRGILLRSNFLTLLSPAQVTMELEHDLLETIGAPVAHSDTKLGATTRRDWRPSATQREFLRALEAVGSLRAANAAS